MSVPRDIIRQRSYQLSEVPQTAMADSDWLRFIRITEIRSIFGDFSKGHFERALELGCGSGEESLVLAEYCHHLTATDFDPSKILSQPNAGVEFCQADAV